MAKKKSPQPIDLDSCNPEAPEAIHPVSQASEPSDQEHGETQKKDVHKKFHKFKSQGGLK